MKHRPSKHKNSLSAFSLVELSIVLVILGLLVGGVMSGASLIKAAQLRTITNDATMFQTAVMNFRQKYHALPGDMANATQFWGERSDAYSCPLPHFVEPPHPPMPKETCNGNGNGMIGGSSAYTTKESLVAWQHLSNSGLLNITGISGLPGLRLYGYHDASYNCPPSRYDPSACWGLVYIRDSGSPPYNSYDRYGSYFPMKYGNVLILGKTQYWPAYKFITPEDLWNIDMKFDDGLPDNGQLVAVKSNVQGTSDCYTTDSDGKLIYDVTKSTVECAIVFRYSF